MIGEFKYMSPQETAFDLVTGIKEGRYSCDEVMMAILGQRRAEMDAIYHTIEDATFSPVVTGDMAQRWFLYAIRDYEWMDEEECAQWVFRGERQDSK